MANEIYETCGQNSDQNLANIVRRIVGVADFHYCKTTIWNAQFQYEPYCDPNSDYVSLDHFTSAQAYDGTTKFWNIYTSSNQFTLLVLIDFCPVQSELLIWSSVY